MKAFNNFRNIANTVSAISMRKKKLTRSSYEINLANVLNKELTCQRRYNYLFILCVIIKIHLGKKFVFETNY